LEIVDFSLTNIVILPHVCSLLETWIEAPLRNGASLSRIIRHSYSLYNEPVSVNDQALSVLVLTDEASASSKLWTGLIKLQRINLPASHDSFSRFGRAREEIVPNSKFCN
jgi:hypothetical protein